MLEAEELEASRRYMESLLDSHMRWSGSMHSLNDGVLFSASRTSGRLNQAEDSGLSRQLPKSQARRESTSSYSYSFQT